MISVETALQIVKKNTRPSSNSEIRKLENAIGRVLFEDVYSPIDMPPFRQSAMDGYALHLHESTSYYLTNEIKAGDDQNPILNQGEAVRIFTGAPVPDTANAVIMQEQVKTYKDHIEIEKTASSGHNIRPIGEQVKKGALALKKGTKLTPATIGYLASLGITDVSVFKSPSVALVATGNEIIEAGEPLSFGKIYESNLKMLTAALVSLGYNKPSIHKIEDDYSITYSLLKELMSTYDVVIISGGISVGDYDFVGKALTDLEVTELFYKVKQKPGKPLFFGKKSDCLIFALPGNPAAVLTCFYVYVLEALENLSGSTQHVIHRTQAELLSGSNKVEGRSQFLKATHHNGQVTILEGQSSAMLQTFALSNALVYIPEGESVQIGDMVDVILLPV